MSSTIRIKRSSVRGKVPNTSNISTGELALNLADKRLYTSNGTATFEIGTNPDSLSVGSGSFTIANGAITFPTSAGSADQILVTDGAGNLSFADQSSGPSTNAERLDPIAVANGVTSYSLTKDSVAYIPGNVGTLIVSLNGIIQKAGTDFTVSGSGITFTSPLVTEEDVIDFILDLGASSSTVPTPTVLDSISTVNGQATYNLLASNSAHTASHVNNLRVSINGVLQEPTNDFTVSGSTITFIPALITNDVVDYIVDYGASYGTQALAAPSALDTITTVNGQASYTMKLNGSEHGASSAENLIVSKNGIIQKPVSDYTVSGSTITFIPALITNDVVDFITDLGRTITVTEFVTSSTLSKYLQVANSTNFATTAQLTSYATVDDATALAIALG